MVAGAAGPGALAVALLAAGLAYAAQPAGEGPQTFRIGMLAPPGDWFATVERALSDALDMKVEAVVLRDYAALIEAQIGRRVDYAFYSAPAYAAASIRCECLRPVALPLGAGGSRGLHSVLILRRGTDADGAEPARIALGPADSLATRLAPMALWPHAAQASRQGRLVAAGSAGEAEAMFLEGKADGFFGWVPAWSDDGGGAAAGGSLARLRAAGLASGDYEIGWRSPILPNGPHAVRADTPQERVDALLAVLRRQDAGSFADISHDDYAAVVEALLGLGGDGG